MNHRVRFLRTASTAVALLAATGACAATIPLRAGDYGDTGLACGDQPNATTMSFDGRHFSYAHASKCIDIIKARSAGVLTITETCRANGDGSAATPSTQRFKMRPTGADRFKLIKGGQTIAFRRCGPLGYFNTH